MRQWRRWNGMQGPSAALSAMLVLTAVATAKSAVSNQVGDRAKTVADQPPAAAVPAAVDAEVTLIHATNDADGGVDPRIGKLPNIGSYKSYKLLSRSNVSIKKAPTNTTLPNNRILQISLKGMKDRQYIIDTSINQPGGTAFLPLLEVRASVDTPVFIAGQSYEGGMLIIAIKILKS